MLLRKIKNFIKITATYFVGMLILCTLGCCAVCFVAWSFNPVLDNISGIPQVLRCIAVASVFIGCLWVVCDD